MATPTFSQLQSSPGNSLAIMVSGQNPDGTTYEQPVVIGSPSPGNITDGFLTFAATTGATTLVTAPAGRTWSGTIVMSCACSNAGANAVAAQATAVLSVVGAGSTPLNGNYVRCDAQAGANVAAGTVGDSGNATLVFPFVFVAPAANTVSLQVTTTQAGSNSQISVSAIGALV